ncbi:MAG: peptidase domain-containing ABC transporter [Bacilli bacterium]|nr:peptidase domain-containing ABC transporter [Bacilli bacterium]
MLKKYPFVKQEGIKDCGCASLLMIIKHYKGYISLERLRDMTKTTKSGTNAYNLIETAKLLGFEAKGIKTNIDDLTSENVILPCIAHVTINESYKHYVVIFEINYKKKTILIGDPADKIKKLTFEEFKQIWNNILIILYPIKPIPFSNKFSPIKFMTIILKNYQKDLIEIWFLSLLITIFSIASSFYFKYMIDSVMVSKHYLLFLFIIFMGILIMKNITSFFRNKLLIYLNQKIDLELTTTTFKQIISLPYNYYRNRTTGEILSRITDLYSVREMISKIALNLFIDLPLTIVALWILYFINHTLFGISIIILILYLLVVAIYQKSLTNKIEQVQTKKAEITSYLVEHISGFEVVKGLSIKNNVIDKFEKRYVGLLKKIFKFENIINQQITLKDTINNMGQLTIIFIGCLLVYEQEITLGTLLNFNAILVYFLDPIQNIIDLNIEIKEAHNALKRILELFIKEEKTGFINKKVIGDIRFNNLSYTYNNSNEILKNITFEIKGHSKVLIIGHSGSGKSTILKLIKKYYRVNRDSLYLDNIDINDYQDLSNISYISQQEILFTDTLYNNLMITDSNTNVLEIANLCYIDEIIKDNNLGYSMLIEENGFNISGGQKQRIILGRTLLKPFDILLIDEGLNQVDINLERKILKNLFNKYMNKTIIVVSHRLENMDLYDQVIEMENGMIKRNICKYANN